MFIKPYVEITSSPDEKFFKKIKFSVTRFYAVKNEDGWIGVYINWKSEWKNNSYKFKYAQKDVIGYLTDDVYYSLVFKEVKYKWTFERHKEKSSHIDEFKMQVGIQLIDEKTNEPPSGYNKINYNPKFHESLGYGAIVWFAPDSFDKDHEIFYEAQIEEDTGKYFTFPFEVGKSYKSLEGNLIKIIEENNSLNIVLGDDNIWRSNLEDTRGLIYLLNEENYKNTSELDWENLKNLFADSLANVKN